MALPPALPPQRARFRNRLGVWLFATVCIVIAPLLPVFVELIKSGDVKPETYLLTAAVLAVGYGFSTAQPAFWAFYAVIFLGSIAYNYNPDRVPPSPAWPEFLIGLENWLVHHVALAFLLFVLILHTLERFLWHVVWDQLFPDWRR
jgi:hypothetical protein